MMIFKYGDLKKKINTQKIIIKNSLCPALNEIGLILK